MACGDAPYWPAFPRRLWTRKRQFQAIPSSDSRFAGHSSSLVRRGRSSGSAGRVGSRIRGSWATARPVPVFQPPIPRFSRGSCGVKRAVANRNFHVHLVSDSTGETVSSVARACLVQYEGIFVQEHVWSLVRTPGQRFQEFTAVHASSSCLPSYSIHNR